MKKGAIQCVPVSPIGLGAVGCREDELRGYHRPATLEGVLLGNVWIMANLGNNPYFVVPVVSTVVPSGHHPGIGA